MDQQGTSDVAASQGDLNRIEAGLTFEYDASSPLPDDLVALRREFDTLADEQQVKHIYALAGLALYASQCFEVELQQVLLLEAKARGETRILPEHDALEQRLSRHTLGRLLAAAKGKVEIDPRAAALLDQALDARNKLAHGYFWLHAEDFCTTAGQRGMMEELLGFIRLFRLADRFCGTIVQVLLRTVGVTKEQLEQQYAKMWERVQHA